MTKHLRRLLLSALAMLVQATMWAAEPELDSLYQCLDEAIALSPQYVAEREERIRRIRSLCQTAATLRQQYQHTYELYEEYRPYTNDSALACISRCCQLARQMGDSDRAALCTALLAFQYSTSGMYTEALEELLSLRPSTLSGRPLAQYYIAINHVYSDMGYYTKLPSKQQEYYARAAAYRDTLVRLLDDADDIRLQFQEVEQSQQGHTAAALRISDERLSRVDKDQHQYAIIAFYRSLDYQNAHDTIRQKRWLAESAICDARNAIMDQGALWELAQLLLQEGQIERAYRYIRFAWDCANHFNTRVRSGQISPVLSTVDSLYQEKTARANRQLKVLIAVVSILSLLLLLSLFYVNRQRKRLHQSNAQLSTLNGRLSNLNAQLSAINAQLSTVNARLHESNRVKEEYIGRFLRLCSFYIDRTDKFRKHVNKMVKNHEYETLYNETRSQEVKEKDIDELYQNFDSAFLAIFPNFVDDFNALLRPEEQLAAPDHGRLSTSLRIFALIRLGIDDSSRIAELLHYSVNTIYNYRARIKNGALDSRDDFEKRVKEIGMPT